jgi:hypothetical protein
MTAAERRPVSRGCRPRAHVGEEGLQIREVGCAGRRASPLPALTSEKRGEGEEAASPGRWVDRGTRVD